MVIQIEIISKEMIKPSSPTTHHLRELKLSFLDQTYVNMYVPFLLFYHADDSGEISRQLKISLSDTLTVFYPLAGQFQDNTTINCNDNGAEFTEARVHAQLSDFVDDPNLEELKQLLPVQPSSKNENIVLLVQASFFDCGGIAVGVCMSHKLGDAASQVEFIRAWAATCRGETEIIVQPRFDLASHFPPRDLPLLVVSPTLRPQTEKVVTKRLILSKEKLTELKTSISSARGSKLKDPSRVEAASAYIWKYFIDATRGNAMENPLVAAMHSVNIRPRMTPPLPEHSFGNCILLTPRIILSIDKNDNKEKQEMHHLAYLLRKAIREINGEYIKEVQADGERYFVDLCKSYGQFAKDGTKLCSFTSWCTFPVYEVDYGWGKPVWVCTTPLSIKNLVVFMSTPCGEGIEAWINLLEDDMKVFQLLIQ